MPSAIKIPEAQFFQVHNAASWLCTQADREQFVAAVHSELAGQDDPGEGAVARVIAKAFRVFYRPIEVPDEPRHLASGRKFEAKLDYLEAHRVRRQRADAL